MKRYHLAYGKTEIEISLPQDADVTVLEPRFGAAAPDGAAAVREALRKPIGCRPLREITAEKIRSLPQSRGCRVGIVFNDITRATPNEIIIPPIVAELREAGVRLEDIVLFNATGTHRSNTPAELDKILGPDLPHRFRVVQNDANGNLHRRIGKTSRGNEIRLLGDFLDCDIRILTGFIEPHFFAGFSGGGKAIMPGLAAMSSIMFNHRPLNIDSPAATWGTTSGNPIFEDVREAAGFAGDLFLVNVTLDRRKRISEVFAGELVSAHDAGIEVVRRDAMVGVDSPFDIVLTSNSGHPLDLNLYQCVKGMSAAAQIVRPGGAIVLAAECWDGLPEHGSYAKLLRGAASPGDLLEAIRRPGFQEADMWQAQIHALIAERSDLYVHTTGIDPEELEQVMVHPAPDIAQTVSEIAATHGGTPRIAVLPEGPLTVAYIK